MWVAAGALCPVIDLDLWHRWAPCLSAEGASRGFHPHHGSFLFLCFKFCLFLYFGCAGFPSLQGLFCSCGEQGPLSSCCAWASHGGGISCCRAQAPGFWGISSCSSRALGHRLNSCGARAELLLSMWDLHRYATREARVRVLTVRLPLPASPPAPCPCPPGAAWAPWPPAGGP